MKILYVCPFAHHSGHPPWAAIHEPSALAQAGADVDLLTFYGIIDKTEVGIAHKSIIPRTKCIRLLEKCISFFIVRLPLLRWLVLFFANILTVASAIRLKKKLNYDVIYLRDGDPFLFAPIMFSIPLRGCNWVISLMGTGLPNSSPKTSIAQFIYRLVVNGLSNRIWHPFFRYSLARNNFLFVVQSEAIKQGYSTYMDSMFSGKVRCIKMGCVNSPQNMSKKKAREHLGLPLDKPILLSFGATHPGKDLETVYRAIKDIPNVALVQAGKYSFSMGQDPAKLMKEYDVVDKVILRDDYIHEFEKPYYFYAADAIVLSYTKQFISAVSLLWDACSFRTPVIASDNSQLGELVKEFNLGLPFVAQDVDSLGGAILRFINLRPKEIKTFKNNCRQFSKEFSIDKWAKGVLSLNGGYL